MTSRSPLLLHVMLAAGILIALHGCTPQTATENQDLEFKSRSAAIKAVIVIGPDVQIVRRETGGQEVKLTDYNMRVSAELVELIEEEEKQVEEFESRQREGAHALVQAIMGHGRRSATRPSEIGVRAPIPAPHFLSKRPQILAAQTRQSQLAADRDPAVQQEIEELGRHLSELAQEVKGNTERAAQREATYAEAADTLLDTQDKLVSQLEVLLDQVQAMKSNETPVQKPRAIA